MLSFEVVLLTGRYVATSFNDRAQAEWPPHPARLFSALVAAHFEALDPPEHERSALRWLEEQGPPAITAPEESRRDVVTVFVPVNDTSIVGSLDAEVTGVEEARAEIEAAEKNGAKSLAAAQKKLAKAEARLIEATGKAIAPVDAGKEGKEGPAKAESVLPERRIRQPRTFPSVAPVEIADVNGRIAFTWVNADPPPAVRTSLDALAARIVRLGHSSSFVSVRLGQHHSEPIWLPDDAARAGDGDEQMLRIVAPGQFAALGAAFLLHADAPGRVMPAAFQRYVRRADARRPDAPASTFGEDWTVLRRVGGPRLSSVSGVEVARTVRKALMAAHGPDAPEILSGHRASGEATDRPHLAYVPLPFVGNEHADGSILGVALVLPRGSTSAEKLVVYRALHAWEHAVAGGDEEGRRLPVHLGRAGVLNVERLEEDAPQSTLRAATWCSASRVWASATPIALNRNPGDLRARDAKKEAAAYAEAETSIAAACEHIGLPRPVRVTATPAAPLAGAEKARHFPVYMTGKPPVQRVLVHATIEFTAAIRGPVLIGAGRYFGLGLFRPVRDHA